MTIQMSEFELLHVLLSVNRVHDLERAVLVLILE